MDSITQILLGSAVAGSVAPKEHKKSAIVAGAILGTLPDLDALMLSAVSDASMYTLHRSFSHSLFVLPIFSLVLVPLLRRFFDTMSDRRLYALIMLTLITHPLLDACTSYGTQLFWPLSFTPVHSASVYAIDPFYSGWLLIGLIFYSFSSKLKWANTCGLILSSSYLVFGLYVKSQALERLQKQFPDTAPEGWFVGALNASPFCWHGVYVELDKYYIEAAFNINSDDNIAIEHYNIQPYDSNDSIMAQLRQFNSHTVLRQRDKQFITSDLRMGEFGEYIYEFDVSNRAQVTMLPYVKSADALWKPSKQNNGALTYRINNSGGNMVKIKWNQFLRCLSGDM